VELEDVMHPDKDQTWLPSWARAEIVFGCAPALRCVSAGRSSALSTCLMLGAQPTLLSSLAAFGCCLCNSISPLRTPLQLARWARPTQRAITCPARVLTCNAARRSEHFDEFNAYMTENIEQHIRKPLTGEQDDDFENMDEVGPPRRTAAAAAGCRLGWPRWLRAAAVLLSAHPWRKPAQQLPASALLPRCAGPASTCGAGDGPGERHRAGGGGGDAGGAAEEGGPLWGCAAAAAADAGA
jgi:hypothetical protein